MLSSVVYGVYGMVIAMLLDVDPWFAPTPVVAAVCVVVSVAGMVRVAYDVGVVGVVADHGLRQRLLCVLCMLLLVLLRLLLTRVLRQRMVSVVYVVVAAVVVDMCIAATYVMLALCVLCLVVAVVVYPCIMPA